MLLFYSLFSPSGQLELGAKHRKWQQNILDLSDLRNIFLKPCLFSTDPLPGMLVLHMPHLIKTVKIPHWQYNVQRPPRRVTAVRHDVPPSVSAFKPLPPSPAPQPSGVFWASCALQRTRAERPRSDSAWGRTQRTHRSSRRLQWGLSVWPSSLCVFRPSCFS